MRAVAKYHIPSGIDTHSCKLIYIATTQSVVENLAAFGNMTGSQSFATAMERYHYDVGNFVGSDIKLDGVDYKFVKLEDVLAVVTD